MPRTLLQAGDEEAEETDEEDDFEEFDFMMFSQLEDTRDVLFKILQNRTMPLQERMRAAEQLAEQYQICMEEQREYDIDDLLRKYEKHLEEGTLSECAAESLAQKGVDAAFLGNKLTLGADWFRKETRDILLQLPVPNEFPVTP